MLVSLPRGVLSLLPVRCARPPVRLAGSRGKRRSPQPANVAVWRRRRHRIAKSSLLAPSATSVRVIDPILAIPVTRLEARIDQGAWVESPRRSKAINTPTIRRTHAGSAHDHNPSHRHDGQTAQTPLNFTFNAPPIANAGGDRTTVENTTVQFDASGSSDTEAPLFAYRWTFDDGSTVDGPTAARHYPQEGLPCPSRCHRYRTQQYLGQIDVQSGMYGITVDPKASCGARLIRATN